MKKRVLLLACMFLLSFAFVSAQSNTVCCEKTIEGAFCQDVPSSECDSDYRSVPTSCDSTSYCQVGTCYDSTEGVCMGNTPQLVCNDNGGIWSEESPAQCELGCCILGDQAAFVSLVRCKKLSEQLGLETNYDTSVSDELSCIATVQAQDKGACVYDFEFEKSCSFTTRSECENLQVREGENVVGEFYKDTLCSSEELGTICGPSRKTSCIDGKDEVYYLDTCGNPANVYDASRFEDQAYWSNVIPSSGSCGFNSGNGNALDPNCGNCNYLQGSYCRDENVVGTSPTYGDFICADLNCRVTSDGSSRLHGESWCVYNDEGSEGDGLNNVGSRYFKHICVNGEEVLEQCGDYREEVCIENDINGFSQAGCRVNRWQDCLQQFTQDDCENTDRRDCVWREGEKIFVAPEQQTPQYASSTGACVPNVPPGLNFWDSEETASICSQGNSQCVVEFEKGLFDGKECVRNCECLDEGWAEQKAELCMAIGDCGPGNNFVGTESSKKGYDVTTQRA